ncbi:uncharacterized protein LOC113873850 [Abrus precatorius]|uniref:Uncharacterized protein LOC113873850 n=1 Tax=Abrus precatorius TaxID=3816 RepID=A0A8B8MK83_ABRPR|nr:uncharacterized protein LOC113873850 [Abrus precatorius]
MDRKEPVDFSSCIHFEASGDSEVDCDPIMGSEIARDDDGDACNDNDDALSCSYDGSGACNAADLDGYVSWDEHDDDDDEKKEDVFGVSCCEDDDEMHEENMKSYVSFDSGQEFVDEVEKNRLFWEACLAS